LKFFKLYPACNNAKDNACGDKSNRWKKMMRLLIAATWNAGSQAAKNTLYKNS